MTGSLKWNLKNGEEEEEEVRNRSLLHMKA
jgi:hypothetical protein